MAETGLPGKPKKSFGLPLCSRVAKVVGFLKKKTAYKVKITAVVLISCTYVYYFHILVS